MNFIVSYCSAQYMSAPPRNGTRSCLAASGRAGATRASSSPASSTRATRRRRSSRGRRHWSPFTPSSGRCSVCAQAPPSGSACVSAVGASRSTRTSTVCMRTACRPGRRSCSTRVPSRQTKDCSPQNVLLKAQVCQKRW